MGTGQLALLRPSGGLSPPRPEHQLSLTDLHAAPCVPFILGLVLRSHRFLVGALVSVGDTGHRGQHEALSNRGWKCPVGKACWGSEIKGSGVPAGFLGRRGVALVDRMQRGQGSVSCSQK